MTTDYAAYAAFLRDGLDRLVNNPPVSLAERAGLRLELMAVSAVVDTLLRLDADTVVLEPSSWYVVECLPHLSAAWETDSFHTSRECADDTARDMVGTNAVQEARVVPWEAKPADFPFPPKTR